METEAPTLRTLLDLVYISHHLVVHLYLLSHPLISRQAQVSVSLSSVNHFRLLNDIVTRCRTIIKALSKYCSLELAQ